VSSAGLNANRMVGVLSIDDLASVWEKGNNPPPPCHAQPLTITGIDADLLALGLVVPYRSHRFS
jgi:hypothetical protein